MVTHINPTADQPPSNVLTYAPKPETPNRLPADEFQRQAESTLATLTWLVSCLPVDRMEFIEGVPVSVVMRLVSRFERNYEVVA